ncbi:hypothetical protein TNCV_4175441 [Trichonephila clavipes]|nr:hypothetical protein TNCV_4175441 [Trichonephila clavipes]
MFTTRCLNQTDWLPLALLPFKRSAETSRNITAHVSSTTLTLMERSTTFLEGSEGSNSATWSPMHQNGCKVAKFVTNLFAKNEANLALPPRFRQVLIKSSL